MEVDGQGHVKLTKQKSPHCAARSDLLLVLRRSGVLLLSGFDQVQAPPWPALAREKRALFERLVQDFLKP